MNETNVQQLTQAEENFMEALLNLMSEKPFSDISVSELAERAGYDRKTYYRHFASKEEVLQKYCSSILAEMATLMSDAGQLTVRSGFEAYFTFWENHMDFLKLLSKNDLLHFLENVGDEFLYTFVGRPVQPDIPETLNDTSDLSRYSFYFTAGGLWHVLTQWIKEPDDKRKSPSEVTDFLINCLSGLAWFIESE